MPRRPLFEGLLFNEQGQPLGIALVGDEPFYTVPDDGFLRHVEARAVDLQIIRRMRDLMLPFRDVISQQILQMLGKDDLFAKVMVDAALQNMDKQVDLMQEHGMPDETRAWLGMMGFRGTVNLHGELIDLNLPGREEPQDE